MNFVSLYFESAGSVGRRSGAVKLGDSRGMANNAPMRERAQRQTPIYRQSQSKVRLAVFDPAIGSRAAPRCLPERDHVRNGWVRTRGRYQPGEVRSPPLVF